ncbi:MAG: hypothetical protein PHN82_07255 [bacterium]|nr:hypothetical protein [bacterium]
MEISGRRTRTVAAALALASALPLAGGCEQRIIRKEEQPFMEWAEKNWKKLTPRQQADYYEMIEKQKERARREAERASRKPAG